MPEDVQLARRLRGERTWESRNGETWNVVWQKQKSSYMWSKCPCLEHMSGVKRKEKWWVSLIGKIDKIGWNGLLGFFNIFFPLEMLLIQQNAANTITLIIGDSPLVIAWGERWNCNSPLLDAVSPAVTDETSSEVTDIYSLEWFPISQMKSSEISVKW